MRSASFTDFTAESEAPTLTFGKHRGVPLADIETSYLEWVRKADRITPELVAAIDAEIAGRGPVKPAVQAKWRAPAGVPKDVTDMARLLVDAGESELNAVLNDHRVTGAAALLKAYLDMVELEADAGTLPF